MHFVFFFIWESILAWPLEDGSPLTTGGEDEDKDGSPLTTGGEDEDKDGSPLTTRGDDGEE